MKLSNFFSKILNIFYMSKSGEKKQSFIMKLIDDDNNYSTVNFFLVAMTIVGIIMLIIPMVGMCIDIWFNHTITINLSDLGSYVLAVSGIFGVAGISNAWVEYSWNRYGQNIYNKDNQSTQYPQE